MSDTGTVPSWLSDEATPTAPSSANDAAPTWMSATSNDIEQQSSTHVNGTKVVADSTTPNNGTPNDSNDGATTSNADAASKKTWTQYIRESFQRDGRLLLITLAIIIVMNIPFVKWVLYPFSIFSTWIHELCHGLAAVFAGGSISKLYIYPDTSGLAYTTVVGARRGFVASAGYQGTAVIGCLLLLVRRTKRGPRSGTMAIALMMILSVTLWIRNLFGIIFIGLMGATLAVVAWWLPSNHMRNVYVCLAVTCSLNAITSVRNLFGSNHVVNGQESSTDAHTMADLKGGSYLMWAFIWLILALVLLLVGIMFAIPGPDQVADFTLCGVCQDLGVFGICNYRGRRVFSSLFSRGGESTSPNNNSDTNNNNAGAISNGSP